MYSSFFDYSASLRRAVGTMMLILVFTVNEAQGADVSRDIREGRQDEQVSFAAYLELGAHVSSGKMPVVGVQNTEISLTIGGHLRVKRFFADFLSESYHRGQVGFTAFSGDIWSVDLIATGSADGIDTTLSNELDGLRNRSGTVEGGVRLTGYMGPFIAQFEALGDISGSHEGGVLTGTLARQYLWQNWNFHWLLGARHYSAPASDFFFGVTFDEAGERFPQYSANAGVTYVAELGATLPVNRYLVFRGTGRYWTLPDAIANSPFIEDKSYSEVSASLVFVY